MDIKMDSDMMQNLIAKTILDTMTTERRDELLKEALKGLMAPPSRGSYGSKSVLQEQFNFAAADVARKIAMEMMTNNADFQARTRELFTEITERLFAGSDREKLTTAICDTISNTIARL